MAKYETPAPPQEISDSIPLPDVHDAVLDRETLGRLFFDLAQVAKIVEIRVKGGSLEYASDGSPNLAEARSALESGTILGVQIRYTYSASEWIDTLIRVNDGVRLVRIQVVVPTR